MFKRNAALIQSEGQNQIHIENYTNLKEDFFMGNRLPSQKQTFFFL